MEQLSGVDSFILGEERGNNHSHVATLALYDQSTAPGGRVRYKQILAALGERLAVSRVFRRRLASVPLGLDRPYWVEVTDLDLEFHVRHIALPEPGDWRQLMIQVARLHSRPLDRSRPLWEMYVIEGLDHVPGLPAGSFAIFTKMHHAAVDGATAIEIVRRLHDGIASHAGVADDDGEPSPAQMVTSALGHSVGRARRSTRFSVQTALKLGGIVLDQVAQRLNPAVHEKGHATAAPSFVVAPVTRFSKPISANRAFEGVGLPFDELRRVRALAPGSTINDVFLALSGAALRRYLLAKNDLPAQSLTALMPISLRAEAPDPNHPGNEVGGVAVALRTDIADCVEQLRAVQEAARLAKQQADLVGRDLVMGVVESLPQFVASALLRQVLARQFNTAVSNVRGPDAALSFVGARLLSFFPVSMVVDGAGINHTAISYGGTLWIGIVACRNLLPDPAFYAECLRASHAELLQRADALAASAAGKETVRRPAGAASAARPGRAPRIRTPVARVDGAPARARRKRKPTP